MRALLHRFNKAFRGSPISSSSVCCCLRVHCLLPAPLSAADHEGREGRFVGAVPVLEKDGLLFFPFFKKKMATKMKGIYKGFKFISQIFVMKEREMEIGYPTDVKHVAHIGWDGHSGSAPSWMNELGSAPDFLTSLGSIGDQGDSNSAARSTWSSQDFELLMEQQSTSEMFKSNPPQSDLPNIPKKQKRKKSKSTLSPKSSSSSRSSSRAAKSKSSFVETGKQANFLHFR